MLRPLSVNGWAGTQGDEPATMEIVSLAPDPVPGAAAVATLMLGRRLVVMGAIGSAEGALTTP